MKVTSPIVDDEFRHEFKTYVKENTRKQGRQKFYIYGETYFYVSLLVSVSVHLKQYAGFYLRLNILGWKAPPKIGHIINNTNNFQAQPQFQLQLS